MYICYTSDMSETMIESMAGARSHLAEDAEDAWLDRLADEAESEGFEGSVSLEEMAVMLRAHDA
jgi:hypothetical protein